MIFKITEKQIVVDGQTKTRAVCREGVNGTGVILPYICGFCKDENNTPTAAFRSMKQRKAHTSRCSK